MNLVHNESYCHLPTDVSIIGIAQLNLDGIITNINKTFADILQYSDDDIKYKPFASFVTADEVKITELAVRHVLNGTIAAYRHERRFLNSQGEVIWLNMELLPVMYNTTISHILCVVQNIGHYKSLEFERDKSVEYLLEYKSDMEQFAYFISHILRAPLANVLGYLEVVNDEPIGTAEIVANISGFLKQMDDRIKDVNHILQGKNNDYHKKENVSFSAIVNEIKQTITFVDINSIIIKTSFHSVESIFCVKQRLYSIFYNIISNSIKYRKPDTNTLIEISSYRLGTKCVLRFKDNGIGIDLNKRERELFRMYRHLHRESDGKGLGLYTIKTHVEKMRGSVHINSQPDVGTEFVIELPTIEDIFQTA